MFIINFSRQIVNNPRRFDTDVDDAFYGGDEVAGVLEPAVWIVGDTAFLVCCDFVAVYEPFEWRSTVDDIPMRFCGYTCQLDMLVDDEDVFRIFIGEPHRPRP